MNEQSLNRIELLSSEQKAYEVIAGALGTMGGATSALADSIGEATLAGQALTKVSQALAVAENIAAVAAGIKAIQLAAGIGFPANIIAITSTVAAVTKAISSMKALVSSNEEPKKFAKGGRLSDTFKAKGPSHANNGIKLVDGQTGIVTGEIEGNEVVVSQKDYIKYQPFFDDLLGGRAPISSMVPHLPKWWIPPSSHHQHRCIFQASNLGD